MTAARRSIRNRLEVLTASRQTMTASSRVTRVGSSYVRRSACAWWGMIVEDAQLDQLFGQVTRSWQGTATTCSRAGAAR
jgi:hypothetical protein